MTVVKICGVRSVDDARAAVAAGAGLVGLNFVPESKRCLDPKAARDIAVAIDGQALRVALFRDATETRIAEVLAQVPVDWVQLHGDESPEFVARQRLPVIKALRGAAVDAAHRYPGAVLLLDHPSGGGGTGSAWDWEDARPLLEGEARVLLAGGLTPENVGGALESLADTPPWGVDVASGVEDPDGRKSPSRMRAFVEAVHKSEVAGT